MQRKQTGLIGSHPTTSPAAADEQLLTAMQEAAAWLDSAHPGWVIFGSAALWLNGMENASPHDIDILVPNPDDSDATWDEGPLFRSRRRTKHCMKGIEVDVSEGLEIWREGRWMPVKVNDVVCRDGLRFASLPDCIRLLHLFDRPKDRDRLRRLFPD